MKSGWRPSVVTGGTAMLQSLALMEPLKRNFLCAGEKRVYKL